MVGKSLIVNIDMSTQLMNVDFAVSGRVMWSNEATPPAPSTVAASETDPSIPSRAADIMRNMKGKLIHTLNRQTMMTAMVGSARNRTSGNPIAVNRRGSGLEAVATSQFQLIDVTTTGTTQGSRNATLSTERP